MRVWNENTHSLNIYYKVKVSLFSGEKKVKLTISKNKH